ncbi:hypothetical protein Pmar_PMAR004710 [Perkinsus marinus ATCC 50983]|uniref:RRM domain-containing protein n=1 Tax=Perkinsus marinus (strain ATCC 50983 / TXsc) TaxID=423536 RepID=C5KF53_PERM5|nr:hypothetical protein Pmar_PMAR004710 [Perkinsus marinus ATCC 50983]EER16858.1 hypothetical protein Pmar_PMAR004710 [Perkinsus marinus ATCC 50983]|eukprot:XP_002785062.1 hypothetical protein Pmar_PMAR004710 [Perkinsus marinus ATCC 50983]
MIINHFRTNKSPIAALVRLHHRVFSVTATREQAKMLDATRWDKLPEGDWLRQDPKKMKKTVECRSIAALQDLSELFWDGSITSSTARKELMKRVKSWETAIDKRASQPSAAWRMLVSVRKAYYLATSNLEAADAVVKALAECRGRSDISNMLQSSSSQKSADGSMNTFEDSMDDLSSIPMQRRTFSEQPIVVLSANEVVSSDEVIHEDQIAFRAPRASAARDKRIPDVRVEILSGSVVGEDSNSIRSRQDRMVFATNLPFGVTREDLAHALGNIGRIVDVEIFNGRASSADSISDSSQSFAAHESRITALIEFETEKSARMCRSNVARLFGIVCTSADDVSNRVMRLEPAIFKRTLMVTRVAWQYMLSEVLESIGSIITADTNARLEMRVRNAPIFEIPNADLCKASIPLRSLRVTSESARTVEVRQDPPVSVDEVLKLKVLRDVEALGGSGGTEGETTVDVLSDTRWFVQEQLNDGIICLRFPTFADTYAAMKKLTSPGVVLLGDKVPQVEFCAKSLRFSEQPIVVLSANEVVSSDEVIHEDQIAFRAPRASAARDKRIPDIGRIVDVEIFNGRASSADSISDSSQSFAAHESRITALIEFETEKSARMCRSNVARLFGIVCTSADDVSNRAMRLEPAIFKRTLMITRVAWQYMLSEVLESIGSIITADTNARLEMRVRNAPIFEIPNADLSKASIPLRSLRVTSESARTVEVSQDPPVSVDEVLKLKALRDAEALGGSGGHEGETTVDVLSDTRWFVQEQLNDGIICLRFPTFADTYAAMKKLTSPGVVLLGDKVPQVEFCAKSLRFSEQPIVVLSANEVVSSDEVIHEDQIALRAPRASAARDKRIPDIGRIVDVEIFNGRASSADSISDSSQSFAAHESRITALIEFETEKSARMCRSNVARLFGIVCTSADDVSNRVMRLEPAIFKRTLMITRVAWQYMLSEVLESIGSIITADTNARLEMRVRNAPIFEIPNADLSKTSIPLKSLRVTSESARTVEVSQDPPVSVDEVLKLKVLRDAEALGGSGATEGETTVDVLSDTRWFVQEQLNDGIVCLSLRILLSFSPIVIA